MGRAQVTGSLSDGAPGPLVPRSAAVFVEDAGFVCAAAPESYPLDVLILTAFVLGIVRGPCFEGLLALRQACRAAVVVLDRWALQQSQPLRPRPPPAA